MEVVFATGSGGGFVNGLVVAVGIEGGEDRIGVGGRVEERVERGIRAMRRRRAVALAVDVVVAAVLVEDQRLHYFVVLRGVHNLIVFVVEIVTHHFGGSVYEVW